MEKIRYSDLPNLGLSKDLSGIGFNQVICFDYWGLKLDGETKYLIFGMTLEKRAKELNAVLNMKCIDITFPEKYEVWFSRVPQEFTTDEIENTIKQNRRGIPNFFKPFTERLGKWAGK